jgi:hypothetical protein
MMEIDEDPFIEHVAPAQALPTAESGHGEEDADQCNICIDALGQSADEVQTLHM